MGPQTDVFHVCNQLALLAGDIGIVLYAASMWVTGIMEGLMWREVDDQGFLGQLFRRHRSAKFPMYVVRGLGGVLFLAVHDHGLEHVDDNSRGKAGMPHLPNAIPAE